VLAAFLARFGVPLRQNYSSTETGVVATDWGAAEEVCGDTVGRPLPGVEVRVGDAPDEPRPTGEVARIWVRSPWLMTGYGFPPRLERPRRPDGWLPTRDLGLVRADGRIVLAGRLDDCIRTREGRLVNLESIAQRLREVEGIDDAAVLPLAGASGASFGAVLVCAAPHALADVRARVTARLPEWAWPRAVVQTPALPRLPSGKLDRQRCIAMLEEGA
jgi:acyl-CoA synthetase (AMP-forming)/AMP-acid ligase II